MNWTEGNLARHSRGRQRNVLLTRQKQHFAKARTALLSGRNNHCPVSSISFLPPESIPVTSHWGTLPRKHHDKSSSPLLSVTQRHKREFPTYLHDDNSTTESTLLEKKKRLLEKSDWVGLGLQKPLDISFPGQIYATQRWSRAYRPPDRIPRQSREYGALPREEPFTCSKSSSMKIRIGSQAIQSSVVAASKPERQRYSRDPDRSPNLSRHNSTSHQSHLMHSTFGHGGHGHSTMTNCNLSRASPTSFNRTETPANVVYSSSLIHEPVPRRDSNFAILRWSPSKSEDMGSMDVEVERPSRPVPSSQESEQRMWQDWVLCENSSDRPSQSPRAETNSSQDPSRNSSSSVALPSHLQLRLPSLHLSSEKDESYGGGSSAHISTQEAADDHPTPVVKQRSLEGHERPSSHHERICQKKPDVSDDLNQIWMKFAHGDDSDSEELFMDVFKEAAHQAAVELRPSDTSVSADEYVETAATCGTGQSSMDHQHSSDAMTADVMASDDISPRVSSESHVATQGMAASETASSNMATIGSSDEPPRNTMRFVVPKPFMGKYANGHQSAIARSALASAQTGCKKKKGRRKRKIATDGRTDIRSLPDFDGDPIEDIEDS